MTAKWIAPAPADSTAVAFDSMSESLLCPSCRGEVVALTSAIRSPILRRKGIGIALWRSGATSRAAGRPVLSSDSPRGSPRVRGPCGEQGQREATFGDAREAERPRGPRPQPKDVDQRDDDPVQEHEKRHGD